MVNELTQIYGYMFVHNKQTIQQWFPYIRKEWNVLQIHKDWHFAISELLKDNKQIDIITIVDCLRDNNRLSKETVYQTSVATNDVPYIRIESLFSKGNMDWTLNEINRFVRDFQHKITDPNFAPDDLIQLCDNTKKLLLDTNIDQLESNDVIIENVLQRHEDAKNGVEFGLQLGWDGTHNKIILRK